MPHNTPRARRVAGQIRRELADLVRFELKDPRVGMLTFTDVEVSGDLSHAKAYFTLMGDVEQIAATQQGLAHAAGFLRSELSHRLRLRTVPELHFVYDPSVERGARLSQLIDEAVASDTARQRGKRHRR